MSIAAGTINYTLGSFPVSGYGFTYTETELDSALVGPVADVVFDTPGKADLQSLFEGLAETGFEKAQIERLLVDTKPPEDWRVGEALAESYLVHHKNCFFPWPDGRDERKSGSSLPGADLVGFQNNGTGEVFCFGEVKTSAEDKYPPGTMYGRTGLKQQVEDLKGDVKIKDDLVKYLAYRAIKSPWESRYKNAARRYLQCNANVRIFGFLVRDVAPNMEDLRIRVEKLSKSVDPNMEIELLAVYLPQKSISSLSTKVMKTKSGGAA